MCGALQLTLIESFSFISRRWKENSDATLKRAPSRLYCPRKLRSFSVSSQLLQMFYTFMISSVFTFGLNCWGGNVSKQDNSRIDKLIRKAGGVTSVTDIMKNQHCVCSARHKASGVRALLLFLVTCILTVWCNACNVHVRRHLADNKYSNLGDGVISNLWVNVLEGVWKN